MLQSNKNRLIKAKKRPIKSKMPKKCKIKVSKFVAIPIPLCVYRVMFDNALKTINFPTHSKHYRLII